MNYSLQILGTEVKVQSKETNKINLIILLIETDSDIYSIKKSEEGFLVLFDKKIDWYFTTIIDLLYYILTEIENLEKEKVAAELSKFYSFTFPEITRDFIFSKLPR